MLIPFQRRVGFGLLLLGALLIAVAVRNLSREYLPAAIEATLEPIQRPVIINLRHQGGEAFSGGAISEMEGIAIIDSPLESALAEYARLAQTEVLRQPSLPSVMVQFRGQDRPAALAKALSRTLQAHGIRFVELSDDRSAAIRSDERLGRGSPGGDRIDFLVLGVGLAVSGWGAWWSVRSLYRVRAD